MKNTKTGFDYILENFFLASALFPCYIYLLFVSLGNLYRKTSIYLLVAIVFLFVVLGIIISYRKNRNNLTLFLNVSFPYQLYAIISYWDYFNVWAKITTTVTLTLSTIFMLLALFTRKLPENKNPLKILSLRFKRAFSGTRVIAALCLSTFIVPLLINSLFGGYLLKSKNDTSNISAPANDWSQWTVENNMDTILKLQPEIWQTLTFNQRLDVLTVIKNIETNKLGINCHIDLTANNMEETLLGYYDSKNKKITINIEHIKTSPVKEVLNSVIHECHHALSHRQVEVLQFVPDEYEDMEMFLDALIYQIEYSDYVSGEESYEKYNSQFCEMDADSYAGQRVHAYYLKISDYKK